MYIFLIKKNGKEFFWGVGVGLVYSNLISCFIYNKIVFKNNVYDMFLFRYRVCLCVCVCVCVCVCRSVLLLCLYIISLRQCRDSVWCVMIDILRDNSMFGHWGYMTR